jgi:hydroxymethylbilane synthase
MLRKAYPGLITEIVVLTTQGDRMPETPLKELGNKGLFTAELEDALLTGGIDVAVHSLKDLPTEESAGLAIGAVAQRGPVNDVLVSRQGETFQALPEGARVGSGSQRRAAQLLHHRPDLQMRDIRGNVDTRIGKVFDPKGPYDVIVLAQAGIDRLGRSEVISEVLPLDLVLPAPGQGALAVQCRNDEESLALVKPLDHQETRAAVTAERAFLTGMGGGCDVPVAAFGIVKSGELILQGRVSSLDGSTQIDQAITGKTIDAFALGLDLARQTLEAGDANVLEALK